MSLATQTSSSSNSYGNGNRGCGTITNINAPSITYNNVRSINTTPAQQPDKANSKILEWISPLELPDKHDGVRELRFPGVGNWILGTPEFKGWEDGSAHPVLFCGGDPGVGKTFISSLVIDTLRSQACERKPRVLYLYCDYLTYRGRFAVDLIAGLLKQALAGLDRIPEKVSQKFEGSEMPGSDPVRPLLRDVVDMLGTVLASYGRVFICIDALDEFPPPERPDLLYSLVEVTRLSETRLFLTGRPPIRHRIEWWLGEGAQIISIRAREEEIKKYITHRLDRDPNPEVMNPGLKTDIMRILPRNVSGIFLLVYLKMNAVLGELTIHKRRERLQAVEDSPKLRDEYNKTLRRITEQDPTKSELALKVLMWLYYSKRPLCADELGHALGVEKGSTKLNSDNVSLTQTSLGCCLGLVTVDEKASTVRFIHSTLNDYLHSKTGLFSGIDLTIAETCLTYLNSRDIRSLPLFHCIAPAETPFLQYASRYWGEHAREEPTDDVKALAKEFLGLCHKHISAKLLLLEKSWPWQCDRKSTPSGFSGLHCAAFFGLQEMAIAFLDAEVSSSSQQDITGSTPLTWAARNGHKGLVQLLLERGSIPDARIGDSDGCTPFLWAARNGHEGVVELFLQEDDIDFERKDSFGRTPLSWASGGGHREVVKLLLKPKIGSKAKDYYGRTPLSWAARNGHEGVVALFLQENDIDLEVKDSFGRTPLSRASGSGHQGVVKLLLGREEISPETKDSYGRTPLSWASGGGHRDVVELLLETGKAHPDSTDNEGRTPISWAAEGGYEQVVDFLLHKGNIDSTLPGRDGRTLLSRAAESGRLPAVELLLGQIDIASEMPDNRGMTPLSWAASKGNEAAVKLFMDKRETGTNLIDEHASISLWWAAGSGHAGVVRLLLGRNGVNPNFVGEYGRTPLMRAAMYGHEEVVKLLLESEHINYNLADSSGRTPLSWAAGSWHDKVVELLLKGESINTELADKDGRTPLLWAARNGDERVVQLLLKEGNAKPESGDTGGRTPFSWASSEGHAKVADLLLSWLDLSPNSVDEIGRTPLSTAPLLTFVIPHKFLFSFCLIAGLVFAFCSGARANKGGQ